MSTILILAVSACTSRQVYDASEGWRRNECNRLLDFEERARCMDTATMPYDTYKKHVDDSTSHQ